MALTFRDTTYTELWGQGFPQETLGQQVSEATRVYTVPWEDRQQAALDFLGYSRALRTTGTKADNTQGTIYYLSRTTPDYHPGYLRPEAPISDGAPYLWADSVTFEPFGIPLDEEGQPDYGNGSTIDEDNEPVYEKAKMTVHYSTRLYKVLSDDDMGTEDGGTRAGGIIDESSLMRYVETPCAVSAQYLQLPEGTFQVSQPSKDIQGNATNVAAGPVPGSPGKIEGQWDVTIIWRQVPRRMVAASAIMAPVLGSAVQNAAIDYAIGKVNSETFAGYPAGTLLCDPPEFSQWIQADGETVFDVTFHFRYFAKGWNYFLIKNTSNNLVYTEMSSDGAAYAPDSPPPEGKHLYDSYNFAYLFYGYDYSAGYLP